MNRLEREISTLKNRLNEIEWNLMMSNESNVKVEREQEQLEHRVEQP